MRTLPEAFDRKRGNTCTKKDLSRQLVESAMLPSLDDALANLSTSSSRLFYQRPTTKTPNNGRQNHN